MSSYGHDFLVVVVVFWGFFSVHNTNMIDRCSRNLPVSIVSVHIILRFWSVELRPVREHCELITFLGIKAYSFTNAIISFILIIYKVIVLFFMTKKSLP